MQPKLWRSLVPSPTVATVRVRLGWGLLRPLFLQATIHLLEDRILGICP